MIFSSKIESIIEKFDNKKTSYYNPMIVNFLKKIKSSGLNVFLLSSMDNIWISFAEKNEIPDIVIKYDHRRIKIKKNEFIFEESFCFRKINVGDDFIRIKYENFTCNLKISELIKLITEYETVETLVSVEDEELLINSKIYKNLMTKDSAWINDSLREEEKGEKVVTKEKILVIGRSSYYDDFMLYLSKLLKKDVYQSDYMEWIDPTSPRSSLLFFLKTAKEIHVNLQGITLKDFIDFIKNDEVHFKYMTSWEINKIYLDSTIFNKTIWHIEFSKIKKENLLKINKNFNIYINSTFEKLKYEFR